MRNKLVYICSPYRGNVEENTENARCYSLQALMEHPDVIPIAPHLLFTQYLDDNSPKQRRIGLDAGLGLLSLCDELWVYGINNPSEGMKAEIELAKELSIPIRDGFNLEAYNPDEDLERFGTVAMQLPEQVTLSEGVLLKTGSSTVILEADLIFQVARQLRVNPGRDIEINMTTEGEL